jgi:hypothetical protein
MLKFALITPKIVSGVNSFTPFWKVSGQFHLLPFWVGDWINHSYCIDSATPKDKSILSEMLI